MKLRLSALPFLIACSLVFAQQPPSSGQIQTLPVPGPPLAPETVVMTVDGKPYTVKEMDEISKMMPPQFRSSVKQNPEAALAQFFLIAHLAEQARQMKLDQESPTKESIEGTVRQILAQAMVAKKTNQFTIPPDDVEAYYNSHKENFETAKISAIYLEFAANPKPGADGKTPRTEVEAKAKVEELLKELRSGADFAALAKANSNDKASAEKGGEYATIKKGDRYPENIKSAVFKLKEGEISDPVKQPAGFYIFKTTAKTTQPFSDVREPLFQQLKQEKFNQWIQGLQKQFTPKIDKPEYFKR
jgi:peptidyl-prolyl cis-trans isomerase C